MRKVQVTPQEPQPDFIVIGGMKCASTTLHAQLEQLAGVFMTDKEDEPNFFSNDEQYSRGIEHYHALFAQAPAGALRGESSTHYTKLPTYPLTVQRMRQYLDDVKLIYIMRHPIDRLVSQYVHEWTQREIDEPLNEAIDRHPELIDYSRYAMQVRPYLEAYGPDRVLPVFFESLTQRPQYELERIGRFIGYPDELRWDESLGTKNVSAERLRASGWRDAVVGNSLVTFVRRQFVPQAARDWIKGFWQMKGRPELSEEKSKRLESIFDEDLEDLGCWLGLELNCANWKRVVRQCEPAWSGWPATDQVKTNGHVE